MRRAIAQTRRTAIALLTRHAIFGTMAMCSIAATESPAAAPQQRYAYHIRDSTYGDIGTYTNVVGKSGDTMSVTTEAHVRISLLGITIYNQDVFRTERWAGGRLASFHGVTTENGEPTEVDGRAEADHFIVVSPNGKITAPGTIRSANPWFAAAPGGDTMLMPDTGLVTKIHAGDGEETAITIGDASTRARMYHIDTLDGREQYDVWIDDSGTPLKFDIKDRDGIDTFTIIR